MRIYGIYSHTQTHAAPNASFFESLFAFHIRWTQRTTFASLNWRWTVTMVNQYDQLIRNLWNNFIITQHSYNHHTSYYLFCAATSGLEACRQVRNVCRVFLYGILDITMRLRIILWSYRMPYTRSTMWMWTYWAVARCCSLPLPILLGDIFVFRFHSLRNCGSHFFSNCAPLYFSLCLSHAFDCRSIAKACLVAPYSTSLFFRFCSVYISQRV